MSKTHPQNQAVAAAMRAARQTRADGGKTHFEVAPGRTWDAKDQERWETLHPRAKADISGRMIDEFLPRWMRDTGISGDLKPGLGGFEGSTNPNFTFEPHDPSRLAEAANGLGHLFRQDSMMAAHEHPFPGSNPSGVVRVHLPHAMAPEEIHAIYKGLHDQGLAEGHSTDPGARTMDILAGGNRDEAVEHAHKVDQALGGKYKVESADAHVAFPQHGEDYGVSGPHPAGAAASVSQADDSVQRQARTRLRSLIAEAGRQGGGHQGPLNLDRRARRQTVDEPTGNRYPGIYGNPKELAAEAASRVAPESPALKRLFGVTRAEMYERGAHRQGNIEPNLPFTGGTKVNPAAARLMTRRNAQRLQDILHEGTQHEGLRHGMMSWYYMDPAFDRLHEIVGHHEAVRRFNRMNTLMGMASPASEVETEINRGLAANYAAHHGRFHEFVKHAGTAERNRGKDFPADLRSVIAHPYHGTAHTGPMGRYLQRGDISDMGSVKVPTYIPASGTAATGFQTRWPVPDAHFTRLLGMADTRESAQPSVSMKPYEYKPIAPWWRDKVAAPMGMEAVPGQALAWGSGSGATGVTSPIGAPKLELLANHIMGVAKRQGIEPEAARDAVLKGETFAKGGRAARADGGPVYPMAPRDQWYGNANYAQTGGKLTSMTPDQFLGQVRPLEIDEASRDNIDDLKNHIQSGRTLDPLSIDENGKEDGRHRAHAARELGIKRVPVLTWPRAKRAEGGFTPSLTPAVSVGGKRYRGYDHLDALSKVPQEQRQAATLDGSNRGFINDQGRWLRRAGAANYARAYDLVQPRYSEWAKTANEIPAEWLKSEALGVPRPERAAGGGFPHATKPHLFHSNLGHHLHVGPIHSAVHGRTDHLPMHVPSGSYVIPADVVSGAHGEGNTMAGFKVMRRLFGGAPYGGHGGPYSQGAGPYGEALQNSRGGRAEDHGDAGVPIVAAGGEYVLSPDQVRAVGRGDPDLGTKVLDEFVKRSRARNIKTLQRLPGPAKD
ncbi:MAG TPA: hypothetical protein VKQ70_13070 [Caulobacteraceae bacterium]|nr:hypothetical protein [Caulobacteraceae bacterium]